MNAPATRRRFLQGTLAAAAAPMFVPRSAFGANDRVNIAAIGVGNRGSGNVFHGMVRSRDDVRVIAACDVMQDRREGFAKRCNEHYGKDVCKPYLDYKEVMALDDVDGVVISTPDHWHVHIAYAAALAKKDMYVEKPLGIAMQWGKKLRKVVNDNKIIFQYGTQQRSMRPTQIGMDLIYNGYIGKIKRCDVWSPHLNGPSWGQQTDEPVPPGLDYDRWLGPAPRKPYCAQRVSRMGAWHIYDYALGFIAGWGAHPLDVLQWGLQTDDTAPVKYQGTGKIASGGLANTTYEWDVEMQYEDGTPVRFMSTQVAKPVITEYQPAFRGDGTTFIGEEGWVTVSRGACYFKRGNELVNTSKLAFRSSDARVYDGQSHTGNFIDCIKSRKPTVNPFESAIRSDTISHLSDIAIRTGQEIHYDARQETITNSAKGKAMLDRPMREPWVM